MNKCKWFILGLFFILAAASCTPAAHAITVTTEGGKCALDGPGRLAAGEVMFIWDIQDPAPPVHGLWILSLEQGKTKQDLVDYLNVDFLDVFPPDWVQYQGDIFPGSPGSHNEKTLFLDARPIYLICMAGESSINTREQPVKAYGVLGPLQVVK